ncbi:MAG: SCP2 sterol-binding domain-containing protein [Solirubrobacterales bacterium]
MARAQDLISTAYRRCIAEVPALDKMKLVIRLELRGRGDVQVFRVRTPGPEISKGEPEDARLSVAMPRSDFNELATEGQLKDWREAVEHGHIKVSGDRRVQRLIENVVERHEKRGKVKRAR